MVSAEEINDLYNKILGRDYDPDKVQKLIRNKFSLSRIEKSILHSNEYKERRNVIFNFDKWVEFGERYTYVLKDKEFTEPPVASNNNLVFIDFRYLDNMEFVIRNALLRLNGTFMVTFVCGLANYDDVKILCSEISQNIKVVKLDKHVINNLDYNKLLLSPNFWKMLDGEKILIHQFDAFILKNNVEEFLNYDYLGSPCYYKGEELIYNGGFSIRTKQVMIDLLETHKPKDISEDIFFSRNIQMNKEVSTKFAFQEEETDAFGCHQMWKVREFSHSEFYDKLKYEKSDIHKYPNLFHKFVLGIRNPYDPIKYEIKQDYFEQKELVAHLHCYDIEKFDEFYGYKIEEIVKYYFTIVTFSKGNYKGGIDNVVILKHENRGGDIGGKFVCNRYLKDIEYEYTNILMLHSKTDKMKRKMYYDPFLQDISRTIKEINKDYGCYVPQLIYSPSKEILFPGKEIYPVKNEEKTNWKRNGKYMDNVVKYMNIPNFFGLFPEGNVYILSREVSEIIYTDLKLFNSLNSLNSFDYSWVCNYYEKDMTIQECFNYLSEKKLFCNNFNTSLGWNGLADCMIEHIFERIIFGICVKIKKRVNILNSGINEDFNDFLYKKCKTISVKPITIIACHTNKEIKLKAVINNIKYLSKLSDKIIIVNSDEFVGKVETYLDSKKFVINDCLTDDDANTYLETYSDLKSNIFTLDNAKRHWLINGKHENRFIKGKKLIYTEYVKNDNLICQGKWKQSLRNKDKNYPFILTNDSFFITRDLDDFKELYTSSEAEMITILETNERKPHYTDFLRYYNSDGIQKLLKFYHKNFKKCTTFLDVVEHLEVESTYFTENRASLYKMKENYEKNLHFDDNEYEKYLEDGYPIIKIKKILFNKYDGFPRDFKADEYKRLHIDLVHMENTEAEQHFINHGFGEGRPYKKNQKTVLPKYLDKYVTSLGLQKIR